jgi:hypothetical protein
LTSGDKSLQNEGFPDWLKDASPKEKRNYYGPMWAQDGNFYIDPDGRVRFQWDRGVVLRDPAKSEQYGFDPVATKEQADLVREFGTPKEGDGFEGLFDLSLGRLKELKSHHDSRIAETATSLHEIAETTKSKLLIDEIDGLDSQGIEARPYLAKVTFSEKSGRLSTLWHGSTATKDDAMRTAILCPPEDIRKYSDAREWMMSDHARRNRVKKQLKKEGLMTGDELDGI